jgi:hypothetical protein
MVVRIIEHGFVEGLGSVKVNVDVAKLSVVEVEIGVVINELAAHCRSGLR